MTKLKFEELNLSKAILSAVKDMGFEEASPIQSEAIPIMMSGKDLIGQAQTGTGKTAAFAIPVIEKLDVKNRKVQAIILCPTRELVIQVAEEFRKIMKYTKNLFVVPVYGGQPIDRQLRALNSGAQVVIGTPGRTMDHIRRGSLNLSSVETIILDEADEMLDMGFREDIEFIIKDIPEERQSVMFSATMAKEILDLTKKFLKDPTIINVSNKKLDAPKIKQVYFELREKNKPEALARLIDMYNVKLALVFCNTKSQVDFLVEILKSRGYFADALHGDMSQKQRDKVMNGFRTGIIEILVATDVAGRGIDVNNLEAVFNYDLPRDDEDYIHRIGRTARAGKSGLAFTFIVGKQIYNLKRIEKINGMQIQRQNLPTLDELEATRINSYASRIQEILEEKHLSKYINHIEQLMGEEYTSLDVAAALFKHIMEKDNEGFDDSVDIGLPVEFKEEEERKFKRKRNNQESFSKFNKKPFEKDNFKRNDRDFKRKPFEKDDFKKKDADFKRKPFEKDDFKKKDADFKKKLFVKDADYKKKDADFKKKPFAKDDFKKKDADFKKKSFKKDDFKKTDKKFRKDK